MSKTTITNPYPKGYKVGTHYVHIKYFQQDFNIDLNIFFKKHFLYKKSKSVFSYIINKDGTLKFYKFIENYIIHSDARIYNKTIRVKHYQKLFKAFDIDVEPLYKLIEVHNGENI